MTTATLTARAHDGVVTREDPAAKPTRRRFSAAYKLAILEEYERCSDSGEKGALLRREGLYTSHILSSEVVPVSVEFGWRSSAPTPAVRQARG